MIAYSKFELKNLEVLKESKRWLKANVITLQESESIKGAYPVLLYQPNMIIRILLFLATTLGVWGAIGLIILMLEDALRDSSAAILMIIAGLAAIGIADRVFIHQKRHYKSGVVESLVYHGVAFLGIGLAWLAVFNENVVLMVFLLLGVLTAIRYADVLITAATTLLWVYIQYFYLNDAASSVVCCLVIGSTSVLLYILTRKIFKNPSYYLWKDCLRVVQALSLLALYGVGNLYVAKLVSGVYLYSADGQSFLYDWIFVLYSLIVPLIFLTIGIKQKNALLVRVGLITIALTGMTFLDHYEILYPEVVIAFVGFGLILLGIWLFTYLKQPKGGFTKEVLLPQNAWNKHVEAFVVSQSVSTENTASSSEFQGGNGGSFGGGGASGSF